MKPPATKENTTTLASHASNPRSDNASAASTTTTTASYHQFQQKISPLEQILQKPDLAVHILLHLPLDTLLQSLALCCKICCQSTKLDELWKVQFQWRWNVKPDFPHSIVLREHRDNDNDNHKHEEDKDKDGTLPEQDSDSHDTTSNFQEEEEVEGFWISCFRNAYTHPHSLWLTHWNIVSPPSTPGIPGKEIRQQHDNGLTRPNAISGSGRCCIPNIETVKIHSTRKRNKSFQSQQRAGEEKSVWRLPRQNQCEQDRPGDSQEERCNEAFWRTLCPTCRNHPCLPYHKAQLSWAMQNERTYQQQQHSISSYSVNCDQDKHDPCIRTQHRALLSSFGVGHRRRPHHFAGLFHDETQPESSVSSAATSGAPDMKSDDVKQEEAVQNCDEKDKNEKPRKQRQTQWLRPRVDESTTQAIEECQQHSTNLETRQRQSSYSLSHAAADIVNPSKHPAASQMPRRQQYTTSPAQALYDLTNYSVAKWCRRMGPLCNYQPDYNNSSTRDTKLPLDFGNDFDSFGRARQEARLAFALALHHHGMVGGDDVLTCWDGTGSGNKDEHDDDLLNQYESSGLHFLSDLLFFTTREDEADHLEETKNGISSPGKEGSSQGVDEKTEANTISSSSRVTPTGEPSADGKQTTDEQETSHASPKGAQTTNPSNNDGSPDRNDTKAMSSLTNPPPPTHTWHVARLTNPHYLRPILWKVFVEGGDGYQGNAPPQPQPQPQPQAQPQTHQQQAAANAPPADPRPNPNRDANMQNGNNAQPDPNGDHNLNDISNANRNPNPRTHANTNPNFDINPNPIPNPDHGETNFQTNAPTPSQHHHASKCLFGVYPTEGFLRPGQTTYLYFSIKALGALMAKSVEAVDFGREEADARLAEIFFTHSFLPPTPFAIRYMYGPIPPCLPKGYDVRRATQSVSDYLWQRAHSRDVRTLYVRARVHGGGYGFEAFARMSLTPFCLRGEAGDFEGRKTTEKQKGEKGIWPVVASASDNANSGNIIAKQSSTFSSMVELPHPASHVYHTEEPCPCCNQSWGQPAEEWGRAFLLHRLHCLGFELNRRRQVEYIKHHSQGLVNVVQEVLQSLQECQLQEESVDHENDRKTQFLAVKDPCVQLSRLHQCLHQAWKEVSQLRAHDPLQIPTPLWQDERVVLRELHQCLDEACVKLQPLQFQYREALQHLEEEEQQRRRMMEQVEDASGFSLTKLWTILRWYPADTGSAATKPQMSPFRLAGSYEHERCSMSKIVTPSVSTSFKQEPAYLETFVEQRHSPGFMYIPPHYWINSKRKKAVCLTISKREALVLGMKRALALVLDPPSLFGTGVYDQVRPSSPVILQEEQQARREKRKNMGDPMFWSVNSTNDQMWERSQRDHVSLLHKITRRDSYDKNEVVLVRRMPPLLDLNELQSIDLDTEALHLFCWGEKEGRGRNELLKCGVVAASKESSVEAARDDDGLGPLASGVDASHPQVDGVPDTANPAQPHPQPQPQPQAPPRPALPPRRNLAINLLSLICSYLGWNADETHVPFVHPHTLSAAHIFSQLFVYGPLGWSLLARATMRLTPCPLEYHLEGDPFGSAKSLRYLTCTECRYGAIIVVLLYLATGRQSNVDNHECWPSRVMDTDLLEQRISFHAASDSSSTLSTRGRRLKQKRHERSTLLSIMQFLFVSIGSFCAVSPHYTVNVLTVFFCGIGLGISMSIEPMKMGRESPSLRPFHWTKIKLIPKHHMTMASILIGHVVGSSGGISFLAEFVVTSVTFLLGGVTTVSTRAIESWLCFVTFSASAFWGFFVARMGVLDGMLRKGRRGPTWTLIVSLLLAVIAWVAVMVIWEWEVPTTVMLVRGWDLVTLKNTVKRVWRRRKPMSSEDSLVSRPCSDAAGCLQ